MGAQNSIHATLAGVTLGLLTRSRPDPDEDESPVCRLEHRLQPWSAGLCVPLFALFAAGVPMGGAALRGMFADPVALAVMVGAARRQADRIFGASFLVVTLTPVVRPRPAPARHGHRTALQPPSPALTDRHPLTPMGTILV